ncbi:NAD(P)/FAD-dependent oxidoreductase [Sinomonas sp. JGH33]|uniref:NAD(P)/FAD-dependent oxidoreductase n=1 Tax=Sinomonas terricola TaxID=3110330 RepID=A0ABU5T787_9MICC|nr:NAD(P)/FAD-dependent oxidoreductase [Sinomonas sp. JGH33]MEA5455453.1 NAD(P)/FAD-dependent oxidoreductase [Sinomonas sp. JGH33]
MTSAVVVGSGPNGLAAAVRLAQEGISVRVLEAEPSIGGGSRSSAATLPGLVHDECSAFHPMALASPFLSSLGLERHGLRWRWPEIELAHPLDGGRAALLYRDLAETASGLGAGGRAWAATVGSTAQRFAELVPDLLGPVLHVPRRPVAFARFGGLAALPASALTRHWKDEQASALFAGIAAHAFTRLDAPFSSAVGLVLGAAGHAVGWPVAEGGSQRIADALVARLAELGGRVETGVRVERVEDAGPADLLLLCVAPRAAARILAGRLPGAVARSYARYRHGPAAFKVDYAIEGDVPWAAADVRRAGTVHLGGTFEEISRSEEQAVQGRMPANPFVLVGQQFVADPLRSSGGLNPLWAYAHVPNGYAGDATEAVTAQIERFAPGFRGRIRAVSARTVAQAEAHNANCVGGDVAGGANTPSQLVFRPRAAADPYATGVPGVFLCSASTPPGGGTHGMAGFHAAERALAHLRR